MTTQFDRKNGFRFGAFQTGAGEFAWSVEWEPHAPLTVGTTPRSELRDIGVVLHKVVVVNGRSVWRWVARGGDAITYHATRTDAACRLKLDYEHRVKGRTL